MASYQPVFLALNDAGVRYVVVDGLATVLHGHARLTNDIDLIIDLNPKAAAAAITALAGLGLQPRVPVDPMSFADPQQRQSWINDKNMQVFTMHHPDDPFLAVDLFVADPMPFDELWTRAEIIDLNGTEIRIAAIDDLITLKKAAGRPLDQVDIAKLEQIKRLRNK